MSDVFISYAREDKDKATLIALALERQNISVWQDRNILIGRAFDKEIEEKLESAKCVVVLWSKAAASSEWVKAEAAEGSRRRILVPVFIEEVKLPLEFRRIQTANLIGWDGKTEDLEFRYILDAVRIHLGQGSAIGRMEPVEEGQLTDSATTSETSRAEIVRVRRNLVELRVYLSHGFHEIQIRGGFISYLLEVDGVLTCKKLFKLGGGFQFEFDLIDGSKTHSAVLTAEISFSRLTTLLRLWVDGKLILSKFFRGLKMLPDLSIPPELRTQMTELKADILGRLLDMQGRMHQLIFGTYALIVAGVFVNHFWK